MSALPPKADIRTWPALVQQFRQLGDIRRDPPRLISKRCGVSRLQHKRERAPSEVRA